ncbi:MAG: L-aspartate oxidase [Pseudomonadota bacterium]
MAHRDTVFETDGALIIGAGLAGIFTALKLAPRPCLVLSPEPLGVGASSAWAQGGIAAAVGPGDSPAAHAADTEAAGAGTVDADVARAVAEEAAARIDDLLSMGTPFDVDPKTGAFLCSREAAHSVNRVVRVRGDRAGRAIMDALIARAMTTPSIQVIEGVAVDDLAVAEGRVVGAFARRSDDAFAEPLLFRAAATVLATGGIGGLYAVTTNPARVRGQGLGLAARAGAVIADPEFVQFHPTGLAVETDPCPLATEALRGHGAIVTDASGHRFLRDIHPDAELAPRDIVARAIHRQVQAGEAVFLDTREAIGAAIVEDFPTIAAYCRDAGIDPVTQPIPIRPTQHYHMGGVAVDLNGRASLPGLWVCGEAASTGFHGANRLASNSLLEATVFGARIAADIKAGGAEEAARHVVPPALPERESAPDAPPADAVARLRALMTAEVGVERSGDGLRRALRSIAALEAEAAPLRGFLNMTTAATLIAAAALARTESRGGHYRLDHPEPDPNAARRTRITLTEALEIRSGC